jgi:hypothetical protein
MRIIAVLSTSVLLFACGGISDNGNDAGSDAADEQPQTILCNGKSCSAYCIHPSTTSCPLCTYAPDSGTCPSGSTLAPYCPAGPPMQGPVCVTYPAPDPPFCSDTIPADCFPVTTPDEPGDVSCMADLCGA